MWLNDFREEDLENSQVEISGKTWLNMSCLEINSVLLADTSQSVTAVSQPWEK